MKNILITGGLGFLGSHLAEKLSKKNKVIALDNLSKRVHPFRKFIYRPKNIIFIESNVNNIKMLQEILPKVDVIYHFASHQDHLKDYSQFIDNNVKSTSLIFEILNSLKNRRLKQFILASSQSVYGNGYVKYKDKKYLANRKISKLKMKKWHIVNSKEKFVAHNESDEPKPINFYGLSKYFQEKIVKQCSNELNIHYTILRYSIVQGSRQSFFNPYSGLCRNLISAYIKKEVPVIFEDGNSIRDFVNINDVTQANSIILNNRKSFNEIFNIGGGKGYNLNFFNEIIREKLNTKIEPNINRYFRVNDPRYTVSNISKARKYLNWKPKNDIKISIEDYIKWTYKKKKYLKYSKNGLRKMISQGAVIDCNQSTI